MHLQVYADGELVGGCDIILELAAAGELKDACGAGEGKVASTINDRIKSMLAAQDVILFMKGNRDEPRCGFSAKVVSALNATGVEYATFDILQDEPIRQGLKEYSNWPTYPQVCLIRLIRNVRLIRIHSYITSPSSWEGATSC